MNNIDTTKITQAMESFNQVLSRETLRRLAQEHGAADKRRRTLALENFFWILVLIRSDNLRFGVLGPAVTLFSVLATPLSGYTITLSRMALSKQIKRRKVAFFQAVFEHLQACYPQPVPSLLKNLTRKLKEWALVDSTAITVARLLKKHFPSQDKGQAALKLHVVFSALTQIPQRVKTTAQRCNDKGFKFVKKVKEVLYIFDLGYWSYALLDRIIDRGSYFVSRWRADCDPVLVMAAQPHWVGKTLSQRKPLLRGKELDVRVRLAKFRSNPMKHEVRLVGQKYKGQWYFYVTNLTDPVFTPRVLGQLYTVRWQIELLFNDLKHLVNVEHIFSRSVQGIQVEIYCALIYYTLTRIVMALAAQQTGQPIEHFSFRRSFRIVKQILAQVLPLVLKGGPWDFRALLATMVEFVIRQGRKDTHYIENYIGALAWGS